MKNKKVRSRAQVLSSAKARISLFILRNAKKKKRIKVCTMHGLSLTTFSVQVQRSCLPKIAPCLPFQQLKKRQGPWLLGLCSGRLECLLIGNNTYPWSMCSEDFKSEQQSSVNTPRCPIAIWRLLNFALQRADHVLHTVMFMPNKEARDEKVKQCVWRKTWSVFDKTWNPASSILCNCKICPE